MYVRSKLGAIIINRSLVKRIIYARNDIVKHIVCFLSLLRFNFIEVFRLHIPDHKQAAGRTRGRGTKNSVERRRKRQVENWVFEEAIETRSKLIWRFTKGVSLLWRIKSSEMHRRLQSFVASVIIPLAHLSITSIDK